ncbi:hypothetical protein A2W24_00255 [Microgenomates group bacterium RBG_16_45_19]|nr:MAG: hypothetical protein A2W24_00255 [Microgenomates group bacterium RBG_16_45_19]
MKTITLTHSGSYTYTLSQAGSELAVIGRFWLKGQDQLDLHLTIIHAAPRTSATTSLKAVVAGRGVVNFNGTIIVKPGASQTNSFLEERVLLLSEKARANAIPNLEIMSADVKCSHAAAIGQIDADQLFYLMSRGLSRPRATHLLAQGFLDT